jgi:DNA-binding transcriptional MerR regulator
MSNVAYQNTSFDAQSSYSSKAQAIAPSENKNAPRKADGAFRTISEVAEELDVPQHVLRFWETKFSQVKPLKRGGGRRYYRPEDVALLKHIHYQLYTEGYTIKGVQKLLKGQGKNQIAAQVIAAEEEAPLAAAKVEAPAPQAAPKVSDLSDRQRSALEDMLAELKQLRALFPQEEAAA